ncbi:MAG: RagB/SusD family nutrient uptake outer membrane protein [Bacteroidaceae bacterium]|nr:RagB/SusD family nutrient uptake outer membrane protein [Bacteroidaceae bacterium]
MKKIIRIFVFTTILSSVVGCSDFFETDSTHVIFAEDEHLHNANDTIYSLIGILNKLQAIGDRTVLFGEAMGDLVDVTNATSADLRDIAMFNVNDSNAYNTPRDYYAVINNCNYYIAHADTALKNNRNEYIFKGEYAVVKGIRAWTYLQLAMVYGNVPFVTTPILTKEDAERDYPRKDIQGVCEYFLDEDSLQYLADIEFPSLGDIKGVPSRLFYIPINIILGDLNLWAGRYMTAARCYYDYITKRNGTNSTYSTGVNSIEWKSSNWSTTVSSLQSSLSDEANAAQSEIISLIPGDSIPSEGYYSQLRNIYNTSADNDYKCSLTPSKGMIDLSAKQVYCHYENKQFVYPPRTLSNNKSGDLRLSAFWSTSENAVNANGDKYTSQNILKFITRNIHIYRRQLIYLRLAEAFNRAGYPRFAYQILASGINDRIINDSIIPHYTKDSLKLAQFSFPNTRYGVYDPRDEFATNSNTMGIHSRGSGFSPANIYYQMPYDSTITDSIALIQWQIDMVEDMIVDEEALEFAFEGYRFYDLMRVALRRNQPSYLADRIYSRRGNGKRDEMKSLIQKDLTNPSNWYLGWKNQIGAKK